MTRTRSPALPAPQTLGQAMELLARYANVDAQIGRIDADRQQSIAHVNAAAYGVIASARQELKEITLQLKPWWAVARDEVTGGKRKSIELGGCVIGYRTSSPKLTHDGKQPDAIERLKSHSWASEFIRTKLSLDKPALLKALAGDLAGKLIALGFKARPQRDEFFIDRVPPKPADTDVVENHAEGEVE